MQMKHVYRGRAQRVVKSACAVGAAVGLAAAGLVVSASASAMAAPTAPASAPTASLNPSQFKGVNWADIRDNFASDPVIPSGLSTSDTPNQTYEIAHDILVGFKKNLGANTVRLPVNPYSVGPQSSWWTDYRQAIRAATDLHFHVVLAYWEGPGALDDGIVDNMTTWWSMWDTLTKTYAHDPLVYFEPMNEPHGYSATDWVNLVSSWLSTYSYIPRDRVFVDGTGYADHLADVCSAAALDGTYLALHDYGFWANYGSYSAWKADFQSRIAGCQSRAVLDEFGSPETTGIDYSLLPTAYTGSTANFVAFLQAATDTVRELHMGSVVWPGLRTGDSYTVETLTGSPTHPGLANTNESGRALIEWGWGRGTVPPHPPES